MNQALLDSLVNDLNNKFKMEKKFLAETKGLIYNYLGLIIDYNKKHYVIFTTYYYLENILEKAPNDMDDEAKTSAKDNFLSLTILPFCSVKTALISFL